MAISRNKLLIPANPAELALTKGWWGRIKREWSSGNVLYAGYHKDWQAADSDVDWTVEKYTWSGDDLIDYQVTYGSWTGRAGLGW
jgi:hypothetical protein